MEVDNPVEGAVDDGGNSENYFEDFAADFERYLKFDFVITFIKLPFDDKVVVFVQCLKWLICLQWMDQRKQSAAAESIEQPANTAWISAPAAAQQ